MANNSSQRVGIIDFVKGIGMFMVLIVHTGQIVSCPFPHLASFGQMGCQIFFVLSAYSLCNSFSKRDASYFKYISHRFIRLTSGYWPVIALYVSLVCISYLVIGYNYFQQVDVSPFNIVVNMLLLNGLIPTSANNNLVLGGWFVGTLFLFYLCFPAIYRLYFTAKSSIWCKYRSCLFPILMFFSSYILLYLFIFLFNRFASSHNAYLYFSLINQLPCLVLGISLFDIIKNRNHKHLNINYIWGGVGVVLLVLSFVLFMSKWRSVYPLIPFVFGCGITCIMFCVLVSNDIWSNIKNSRITGIFEKTGLNSFGIYLLHPIIVYYLIPTLSSTSIHYISIIISNEEFANLINYGIMLLIVFGLSSMFTVIFNNIQENLYSWMNRTLNSI